MLTSFMYGPGQANLVVTTYASSEGSGDPAPRQNLSCSLKQAMSQEEPSDRKPDPWPLWMTGHEQLKFFMTRNARRHKFAWRGPYSVHIKTGKHRNTGKQPKYRKAHINTKKQWKINIYSIMWYVGTGYQWGSWQIYGQSSEWKKKEQVCVHVCWV